MGSGVTHWVQGLEGGGAGQALPPPLRSRSITSQTSLLPLLPLLQTLPARALLCSQFPFCLG